MARPTKNVSLSSRHLTNDEKSKRQAGEENLKGNCDKLKPPKYLTLAQKRIFKYILENLKASGILGNLDVYVLTNCAIAIDRIQMMETAINANNELLNCKTFMASKDKYSKDFFRYCNELSLSPQSRAKLANINLQSNEVDPLLEVLLNDD
jgi:P27 family predicted phage terminase small subunit